MRESPITYKRLASSMFVLGIVFLGTTGVQFVVDGNSKGAPGTVTGVVAILVGVHNLIRARRAEKDKVTTGGQQCLVSQTCDAANFT